MKKKNQGLADNQEGEFILNESATSVSTDQVEGVDIPAATETTVNEKKEGEEKRSSSGPKKKTLQTKTRKFGIEFKCMLFCPCPI